MNTFTGWQGSGSLSFVRATGDSQQTEEPVRSNPTGRQLRFGVELRKLRERAGLTATGAGRLMGIKQTQVSTMEAGRVGVSAERVRALARHYGCSDQALVDALSAMTTERSRGWWEEYREILPAALLDLAEVEHHAGRLRTAVTMHIPGLLQTTDHARELLRHVVPELSHRRSSTGCRSASSARPSSSRTPRPLWWRSSTRRPCACGSAASPWPRPSCGTCWT